MSGNTPQGSLQPSQQKPRNSVSVPQGVVSPSGNAVGPRSEMDMGDSTDSRGTGMPTTSGSSMVSGSAELRQESGRPRARGVSADLPGKLWCCGPGTTSDP